MDSEERILKEIEGMRYQLNELEAIVRGNQKIGVVGLLVRSQKFEEFMEKWDRREYMARGVIFLLTSNVVLTVLAIIAPFVLGG